MNTDSEIKNGSKMMVKNMLTPELIKQQGIDMESLIGTPHLYGRFYETREGFMIVPSGVMTMQADGRITGYSSGYENRWTPYEWGSVEADKAFAFITKNNDWIPSSSWQQTFAGMPIGYFCDEPEVPQKLCLVPHTENNHEKKVVYLVASCLRFYEKTVPKLLKDLFAESIEPERIKVVVNGCEENYDKVIDGISHAFSTHDAWEWSALYEAPLRWQFDYAMLIHDTNFIYPGFKRKVESFNQYLDWDYLPATPLARCLLGLYSHSFLKKLNNWLKKIDGIDKQNGVLAEVAGELLHRAKTVLVMSDPESNGAARSAEWREKVDVFNTGSPRIRRVFPSISLHKFLHAPDTSEHNL